MAKLEIAHVGRTAGEIAPGVGQLRIGRFVNAYRVDAPEGWVLVDAGLPRTGCLIRRAVERHYGGGTRPAAILLTHGHWDHAGAARDLADTWDVPVYAHRLELPYLDGRSDYPPQDPTVGGAVGLLSRLFPHTGLDLGTHLRTLPGDSVPGLPEWRWIHTPGHTPGHVAFFRERDGVLLVGDALATENQDSVAGLITRRPVLNRPPAPFTTDWTAAIASVNKLAALGCRILGAGHGVPVRLGGSELRDFAQQLRPPHKGRYVVEPAVFNDNGILRLPPPVADPLPKIAAGVAIAAVIGTTIWKLARKM